MTSLLSTLEKRLAADFARYHIRAQALRFVASVASTFALQLATGTSDVGWKAALATLFGIAVTTGRQLWPTLPWKLVTDHLHAAQAAEVAPRTGMAANPPSTPVPPAGPAPTA
ncbi:hypothetical protein KGQ19_16010 [Catenulispora sp. NL8]|uniref:Uncharacterized protein n=1 Tax=Catenulispora pinistramenti TaxID=2705254 RepID=A0ABS5KQP5_9ACTN|nr:hypothetical protein [Catenulispora pinistramenti]MBS2548371.1 hypothetical protein [Catenulispora pinistramenti]